MATPLPASKEAVVETLEGLGGYQARARWAATVGRDHKSNPQLPKLIADVRKHPNPPIPQYEAEEGFTEILPGQQNNVSKYYHEDHFALTCAAASQNLGVMVDELRSPSIFFKQKAAREVARLQKSDEELYKEILASVPFVRSKLLHAAIEQRRTALIDRIFPVLAADYGIDAAAAILHGCSGVVVEQYLKDENYRQNNNLHWTLIARHHAPAMVALLRSMLETAQEKHEGNDATWTKWQNSVKKIDLIFCHANLTRELFQLALKYPNVHSYLPVGGTRYESFNRLPTFVNQKLKYFVKQHSIELLNFIKDEMVIEQRSVGKKVLNVKGIDNVSELLPLLQPAHRISLASIILERSSSLSFYDNEGGDAAGLAHYINIGLASWDMSQRYYRSSLEHTLLSNLDNLFKDTTMDDVLHLVELFSKFFTKISPPPKDEYRIYISTIMSVTYTIVKYIHTVADKAITKAKEKKKTISLHKFEQAFNAAVDSLLELVLPAEADNWFRITTLLNIVKFTKHFPDIAIRHFRESAVPVANSPTKTVTEEKMWNSKLESVLRIYVSTFGSTEETNPVLEEVVNFFLEYHTPSPIPALSYLASGELFDNIPFDLKLRVVSLYSSEEKLKYLALNNQQQLLTFLKAVDTKTRLNLLKTLLAEGVLNKAAREKFLTLQDIEDPKVRTALQKGTDSSSIPERVSAIDDLVKCTFLSPTPVNVSRTLAFLRKKLKNVSVDQRSKGLAPLFQEGGSQFEKTLLAPGVGPAVYDIWFSILDDVLQSPDLDSDNSSEFINHQVLKYFASLSSGALIRGALQKDDEMFNFGVEIQWRVVLFRKGNKRASEAFFLNFGGFNDDMAMLKKVFEDTNTALHFVDVYLKAYSSRISEKYPNWAENYNYYIPLLNAAQDKALDIPILRDTLARSLSEIKTQSPRDADGLYVIDGDNVCTKLFSIVIKFYKDWDKVPLISEYIDTMIRSRLAFQFIFMWMKKKEEGIKVRKLRAQKRDECVRTLLSITPSSIHLRFVQRHLLRWHQNLLDPYILAEKTFRGVFYQPPKEDQDKKKKKSTPGRGKRSRVTRSRGGGRSARVKGGRARRSVGTINKRPTNKNVVRVEEEQKAEADLPLDTVQGDHREFFCIDLCFGLRKLLPRQAEKLAEQWLRQVTNPGRPLPSRTHAIIRYTLMPTTDYPDVVATIGKLDALSENGQQPIPVNLIEALLKGVMYTDEPCAPLHYLFSPKFLQSDRARISVNVAAKCVPYMKVGGLTNTLGGLLEGPRRSTLKVTTHKAIVRLLMSMPTEEHIKIIIKEWKHKELHRDVRITILQEALLLLTNKKLGNLAWSILDTAVETPNAEVQAAIIGSTHGSIVHGLKRLFQRKRLQKSLDSLRKITIPNEHRERFARNVVWKLASSARDEDIKVLAMAALGSWGKYGIAVEAANLLSNLVTVDLSNPLLISKRIFDQNLYTARWREAANNLVRFCGMKKEVKFETAPKELVVKAVNSLVEGIKTTNIDSLVVRNILVQNLTHLLNAIPPEGFKRLYNQEIEDALMAPLDQLNGLYWRYQTKRKVQQLAQERLEQERTYTSVTYVQGINKRTKKELRDEAMDLVRLLLRAASQNPARTKFVLEQVNNLVCYFKDKLVSWQLQLTNFDETILPSLLFAAGFRALQSGHLPSGFFQNKANIELIISFFKRVIAGSPSHDQLPHSQEQKSLTKEIVEIMDSVCKTNLNSKGRLTNAGAIHLVKEMLTMFEEAATLEPQKEPSRPTSSLGAATPWISNIWRRLSSYGAELEETAPTEDADDNAFTTLRLKLGYHMLDKLPGRIVEACPEKVCHVLDYFLVTHCFEKKFGTIYKIFDKFYTILQNESFATYAFLETLINLNLPNTVLSPSSRRSSAKDGAEGEEDEEEGADEDYEEEGEHEKEEAGEEGYEGDAGDNSSENEDEVDISADAREEEEAQPKEEEETVAPQLNQFGDRYVNYSMLIALKLIVDHPSSFPADRINSFHKLTYWAMSTSISHPKLKFDSENENTNTWYSYSSNSSFEIDFMDSIFTIANALVDPYMIDPATNMVFGPPVQWAIDFIDFLIGNSIQKFRHPYVRKLSTSEIHSVSCYLALRILAHLGSKLSTHSSEEAKSSATSTSNDNNLGSSNNWISELKDRVRKLSIDEDPVVRNSAFRLDFEKMKRESVSIDSFEGEEED